MTVIYTYVVSKTNCFYNEIVVLRSYTLVVYELKSIYMYMYICTVHMGP